MKKKLTKKLALKKSTISNLDNRTMVIVKAGGDFTVDPTCYDFTCATCQTCTGINCPTARCITPASELSYCDCTTIDIACPTGNPPVC